MLPSGPTITELFQATRVVLGQLGDSELVTEMSFDALLRTSCVSFFVETTK